LQKAPKESWHGPQSFRFDFEKVLMDS
jgi:hypothetical protein